MQPKLPETRVSVFFIRYQLKRDSLFHISVAEGCRKEHITNFIVIPKNFDYPHLEYHFLKNGFTLILFHKSTILGFVIWLNWNLILGKMLSIGYNSKQESKQLQISHILDTWVGRIQKIFHL